MIRNLIGNKYVVFAAHCTLLGAVVGALFTMAIQFLKDYQAMGWAGAWDMLTNLTPWEWMNWGHLGLMTLGSMVLTPVFMTLAFWFAESPRWNK